MTEARDLIFKRARWSRLSGEWSEDDYDVLAAGEVVGRINKVKAALRARHGFGHLPMNIITTARRYMATRRRARLRWRHSQRAGGGSEIWPNRRRTRPNSRQ
jgi:hypothetical protein